MARHAIARHSKARHDIDSNVRPDHSQKHFQAQLTMCKIQDHRILDYRLAAIIDGILLRLRLPHYFDDPV